MKEQEQYDYLKEILEEEFTTDYWRLYELSILDTEIENIKARCESVFEEMGVDEEDRMLRYAVIGTIAEYFEGQQV
jgi:hypothetical protein